MGIKQFTKWLQRFAPDAMTLVSFDDLKGKRIGIDASLLIYKCVLGIRALHKKDLVNNNGDLTSHLYAIFYKILKFLENNIIVIFVFDGKSPDIKKLTLQNRKEQKEKSPETSYFMQPEHITMLKDLLKNMGIPFIQAKNEADPVLAHLERIGYIDGVGSDDTDILIFGCNTLYKNLFQNMTNPDVKGIQKISLNKITKTLDWTKDNLIDLCLLLGTDYTPSIRGMGIVKAHELYLRNNLNLNLSLIELQKNNDIDIDLYIRVKRYFKKNDLKDDYNFIFGPFKCHKVYDIMVIQHNFNEKQINNAIIKYKNIFNVLLS